MLYLGPSPFLQYKPSPVFRLNICPHLSPNFPKTIPVVSIKSHGIDVGGLNFLNGLFIAFVERFGIALSDNRLGKKRADKSPKKIPIRKINLDL